MGCSSAGRGDQPKVSIPGVRIVDHTYVVPQPLELGRPGDLIAASDNGSDPLIDDAERWTLLYHSSNLAGRDIPVSGALFVPRGVPPAGGWPVISWGHGTTGIADRCAPSQTPNLFYNEYAQEVRAFVHAGYAVAATDYPGLGTPGVHTYLIGVDEGNAMADIVTAARHLDPRLSTTWFAVGHSQGGQAALFATRAATRDPALHLGGSVAIAPASGLNLILPAVLSGNDPADLSYSMYALIGLSAADPSVVLSQLLGPAGQARLPLITERECLTETDAAFKGVVPADILRIAPNQLEALNAMLGADDNPDNAPVNGPVLVIQGAADQDVPAAITGALVQHLRAQGSDVTEQLYPDLDHDGVLGPSACDLLTWLSRHGGPPLGSCQPQPTDLS